MESITLVLKIDGKDKKFVSPKFITGKLFRQASEIAAIFENQSNEQFNFEEVFQFICNAFGNKFEVDQFEEGIDSRIMMKTIYAVVQYVVGNVEQASLLLAQNKEDGIEEKN